MAFFSRFLRFGRPKLPSVDVLFDLARERIQMQRQQMDVLDNKANAILTAGGVMVGFAVVLFTATASAHSPILWHQLLRAAELVPLSGLYFVVLICAYRAYIIRDIDVLPKSSELPNYLTLPEEMTKHGILLEMVKAYQHNATTIENKVRWIKRVQLWWLLEMVALVPTLLVIAVC